MTRVVVLREKGTVTVLTEIKGIRTLVIDRNTGVRQPFVRIEGALSAVDAILDGIPKVMPERVSTIFEEVSAQRGRLVPQVSTSDTVEQSTRRLVVLLKNEAAPSVLVADPTIQVLIVDRDHTQGHDQLQVEDAPATISTLYQVAKARIDHIFAELAPQIDTVMGAPELVLKDRVQLSYLARNWLTSEEVFA